MDAKEALLSVFKSTKYYNGVVKYVVLPPLKALAESSSETWDDTLIGAAEGFLDKLLPVD